MLNNYFNIQILKYQVKNQRLDLQFYFISYWISYNIVNYDQLH